MSDSPTDRVPNHCEAFRTDELEAAALGRLRDDRLKQLDDHLDTCPVCLSIVNRLLSEKSGLIQAPAHKLEPDEHLKAFVAKLDIPPLSIETYEPGDDIGPYRVVALIGQGGFSKVYECLDHQMARRVAVKVLDHPLSLVSQLARQEREARLMAQLDHPGIVRAIDIKPFHAPPYIVMELVAGGPSGRLLKNGPLAPRLAARLVAEVARAVHHAHEKGVLHRDIKPSNLLVVEPFDPARPIPEDLTLKVSDFGLARPRNDDSTLTGTDQIIGTPAYMSPEQAHGRQNELSPASDVYSLGVVLYEFLVRRPPLVADNPLETLRLVTDADPIPPRRIQQHISRDLDTICLKCLRKNPAERYASAAELADDLQRYLENRPILARPISQANRLYRWARRNPGLAASLAGSLALLVSTAVLSIRVAYVQNQLRLEADARSAVSRKAVEDAALESDSLRNVMFNGVNTLATLAAELDKLEPNPKVQEISAKARSMNRMTIDSYLNRPSFRKELNVDQAEIYFRDSGALRLLGFSSESTQMMERLLRRASQSKPGDPEHTRWLSLGNRSAYSLARLKLNANDRSAAIRILTDAREKFRLGPNLGNYQRMQRLERYELLRLLLERLDKTQSGALAEEVQAEQAELTTSLERTPG